MNPVPSSFGKPAASIVSDFNDNYCIILVDIAFNSSPKFSRTFVCENDPC